MNGGADITTTLMLRRLLDRHDEDAWRLFDQRFRDVVIGAGRRLGLSEADAEDAAQETMLQVVRDYRAGRYNRERGRLSSWIVSIAHHRIVDIHRARRAHQALSGAASHGAEPAFDTVAEAFEEALNRKLFEQAWDRLRTETNLRPATIRAFELTTLLHMAASEAAAACEMSVEQVYVARNRVAARLRSLLEEVSRNVRDGL